MTIAPPAPTAAAASAVQTAVAHYWGYTSLKPLQAEAIEAGINGEDSLVVLPTGGGKSLCYQVPAVVAGRTDVVVSPLIALMKDQVDGLRACGYPAAAIHSGLEDEERRQITAEMTAGKLRLVFVSPERLLTPWFLAMCERAGVNNFTIDEAHCISQWGHDFRPEYRRIAELRDRFPNASIHAFTATATERVRRDIVQQLELRKPRILVGRFDRPNLTYRVIPRQNLDAQIVDTLKRHKDEAAIVYCISRKDTEAVAGMLKGAGFKAAAYHAGMDSRQRSLTQDAFAKERLDVVVATVAFGMGIDRSNVRCVIHAAMPKSIEHYQQETGRAGRDGLEAECVLFRGGGDSRRWEMLMERSAAESSQSEEQTRAQLDLVREMEAFGSSRTCRHRALSVYFGQDYALTEDGCGACDVCLSTEPPMANGTAIARRIVDCVTALGMPFGAGYVADVLAGSKQEKIRARKHDGLACYGALSSMDRRELQQLVLQMVELGLLDRSGGDRPVVTLTPKGRELIKGNVEVELRASEQPATPTRVEDAWQGVDKALFEELRALRRAVADERQVPPFVIFSDATLRELAKVRPVTAEAFLGVKGVGERKQAELGERFVGLIAAYCREHQVPARTAAVQRPSLLPTSPRSVAFGLFDAGKSIEDVARETGRATGTISAYLEGYIDERRPENIDAWVPAKVYERVVAAAGESTDGLLRPVFEALNGEVSYEQIRVVMKHAGLR
jgi:ATP-dependent DNA helicase RecQ